MSELTLGDLLSLASDWHGICGNSSSKSCLEDATNAIYRGDRTAAKAWIVRSLAHSVGIFHHAYKAAAAA